MNWQSGSELKPEQNLFVKYHSHFHGLMSELKDVKKEEASASYLCDLWCWP